MSTDFDNFGAGKRLSPPALGTDTPVRKRRPHRFRPLLLSGAGVVGILAIAGGTVLLEPEPVWCEHIQVLIVGVLPADPPDRWVVTFIAEPIGGERLIPPFYHVEGRLMSGDGSRVRVDRQIIESKEHAVALPRSEEVLLRLRMAGRILGHGQPYTQARVQAQPRFPKRGRERLEFQLFGSDPLPDELAAVVLINRNPFGHRKRVPLIEARSEPVDAVWLPQGLP